MLCRRIDMMNLKDKKCEYCDNPVTMDEGGGYPPLCEMHMEEEVNAMNEYFAERFSEIEESVPEEFEKTFKKRYKDILA
jgi:hypothetical protein